MINKISFFDAASELERICEKIDTIEELDKELTEQFDQKLLSMKEMVDKRARYLLYAESQIKAAERLEFSWATRKKSFTKAYERIKANTLHTMKCYPDTHFNGTLGGFRIQKNPKKLVIDETKLDKDEWYIANLVRTPNKEAILKALVAGDTIEGARIEQGEHVRFVNI